MDKAVPCKWCDTPTLLLGTQECDSCWELRRRLDAADPGLVRRMLGLPKSACIVLGTEANRVTSTVGFKPQERQDLIDAAQARLRPVQLTVFMELVDGDYNGDRRSCQEFILNNSEEGDDG